MAGRDHSIAGPGEADRGGSARAPRARSRPHAAAIPGEAPAVDAEAQRLLFDHISDAVFATDAANRFTHWTASAERLFGYSAAEAVGRPFEELLPYRVAPGASGEDLFVTLAKGQTWRGTGTVRLRDGREIWIESTVVPILTEGRLVGSVSVAREVTATVDAQRNLADQERFVGAVLEVIGALVLVLDPAGRIERFNEACEHLTGYSFAEVAGRAFWELVIPPDEVDDVRAAFDDLSAGAYPSSHENHWLARTGALRLIHFENTCLTDDGGAVSHVIKTGIDITEARRGEDALHEIEAVGRLLAEQGAVPAALEAVLGELESRMGYRQLSLYVRDGDGLNLGAQRGYRAVPERLDAGRGVIGRVYRTGLAELVRDVRSDPDYISGAPGVVAEIAAPLLGGGAILGVLNVESDRPDGLTEDDLRLARAIADRLSSALMHHKAQEALAERARLFAALAEFAAAVNAIRDPGLLVAALGGAVSLMLPADTAVITTLDRGDALYHVRSARGLDPGAVGAIIVPGEGTAGRAISERTVILTEHQPGDPYSAALRDHLLGETRWVLGVPLISDDRVLGVISVGRFAGGAGFTQSEIDVFGLLGSHAALALANANLIQEVSELAIHDGLTGLYNRRHFDVEFDRAIARYKRRGPAGNLAAIMFDLDHFGDFNRRHGHLAGDAVLRLFAGVLHERLRSADLVARYGGEEFIVILEDCAPTGVVRVADEVRRGLEARSVPGVDDQPLRVTVSAGCAVIDPADPTREALIGRADAGLFMAKRAGRNRVVAV